jgi:hypothetical protein
MKDALRYRYFTVLFPRSHGGSFSSACDGVVANIYTGYVLCLYTS